MTGTDPAEPEIAPVPDASGHFSVAGIAYGGRFAPEALTAALDELAVAYQQARRDPAFTAELDGLLKSYAGRPTLLTRAKRFGQQAGGATVLLKREDLTHTGSHKINNVLGQVLLAQRMGKTRVIAETGAGQHGVATATAAALLDLDCVVYMGEEDTHRQALNVSRMRMLGAEVIPVDGRHPHAQGRHERGLPGLGDHRRAHALLHRLGGRSASVPDDGQGLPADHRRGGQGASAAAGRSAA